MKFLTLLLTGIAALTLGLAVVQAKEGQGHTPVAVCHWVPAHGGSYAHIVVDDDGATGNKNARAHKGHERDVFLYAEGDKCPAPAKVTQTSTPTLTRTPQAPTSTATANATNTATSTPKRDRTSSPTPVPTERARIATPPGKYTPTSTPTRVAVLTPPVSLRPPETGSGGCMGQIDLCH